MDLVALGAGLAELAPGPELCAALAQVWLGAVPNDQVIEVLRAQARQLAHEQARMLATLVEVSRTTPGLVGPARADEAYEWASGEISAALRWTGRAADRELAFAQTVVSRLPRVFAALWAGRIDRARAWVFADHLDDSCGLSGEQVAAICAHLVPLAEGLTTGELAGRLLRAILAVDPDHAQRRYRRAVREREVVSYLDRDGTVTISAHRLAPDEAAAATERLRALAAAVKRAGHPGRLPQIQADLFCALLNGRYHHHTRAQIIADMLTHAPDKPPGARAGVEIRVGLGTLLGRDDDPGEIPGLGPVLASTARDLVAAQTWGGRWRYAVVDPDGYLILAGAIRHRPTSGSGGRSDGGIVEIHVPADLLEHLAAHRVEAGRWAGVIAEITAQYRDRDRLHAALDHNPAARFADAALARHTEVRDRTCTFIGCRCPARHCDLDHTIDHAHGGATTHSNLGPGCGRHHPFKHKLGWRLEQPRPGHFTWTSPLGHTYHTRGQPITPPHAPRPPPVPPPF
ncbi:HNH endonuclease signature motif containing protein [Pseudonocardia acaciae]|uniref:HNH endonuclease signature motif containing protein n=1 Tax=Pseudonocardia acaciae TaxID=551276 RepID=UPI00055FA7F8|nr:HNH endonuclease signature motif containing protein [Pseudonocardia acaciae]